MRLALPVSAALHLGAVGLAWAMLNSHAPESETGVESVTVDILTISEVASIAPISNPMPMTEVVRSLSSKARRPKSHTISMATSLAASESGRPGMAAKTAMEGTRM